MKRENFDVFKLHVRLDEIEAQKFLLIQKYLFKEKNIDKNTRSNTIRYCIEIVFSIINKKLGVENVAKQKEK